MVQIRRADEADIPELVRLKEVLMADGWPWGVEVDDAWRDRCAKVAGELLATSHFAAFVIDADTNSESDNVGEVGNAASRLAACVTVAIEQHLPAPQGTGRSAYIGDMCTDAAYRGRGYGTSLLREAMDWAVAQGAGWASLFSTERGRHVYLKAGFDPKGPFEHLSIGLD